MDWQVTPEPSDDDERRALVHAAEEAMDGLRLSVWWSSGLEELGGGPAPQQTWRQSGVVEP
jgi:hypothetical protein